MPVPGRKQTLTGRLVSALGGPWAVLLGIPVIALFYSMHLRGPNLPHNLAELFSVVVAVGIFMLTWNARRFIDNHYFLFLGIAYLFVGIVDSLHALTFDGRIGSGRNLDIQFWYAARILQGVSLVIAPRFAVRKVRPGVTFAAFFAVTAVLVTVLSVGDLPGLVRPRKERRGHVYSAMLRCSAWARRPSPCSGARGSISTRKFSCGSPCRSCSWWFRGFRKGWG